MMDFYVLEIKLGHITLDQVNKFWRAKVQAKLDELDIHTKSTNTPGSIDKL